MACCKCIGLTTLLLYTGGKFPAAPPTAVFPVLLCPLVAAEDTKIRPWNQKIRSAVVVNTPYQYISNKLTQPLTTKAPLARGCIPVTTKRALHGTHRVSFGVKVIDLWMCSIIWGASVVSIVVVAASRERRPVSCPTSALLPHERD